MNGVWLEGAQEVKSEIYAHFKQHFSETTTIRPSFTSNNFLQLYVLQASVLERPITAEEIKSAVWACEGSKAPGPDGFTFNFI